MDSSDTWHSVTVKDPYHSDKDWLITFLIDNGGSMQIFDSLGNIIYTPPYGIFVLFKIVESYFFQEVWYDYKDFKSKSEFFFGEC